MEKTKIGMIDYKISPKANFVKDGLEDLGFIVDAYSSFNEFITKNNSFNDYCGLIVHLGVIPNIILNNVLLKYPHLRLAIGSLGAITFYDKNNLKENLLTDISTRDNKEIIKLLGEIPIFNYSDDFDEIMKYFKGE